MLSGSATGSGSGTKIDQGDAPKFANHPSPSAKSVTNGEGGDLPDVFGCDIVNSKVTR